MNKLKSLYTDKQIEILKQTQKQDWFMLINHGAKRTGKTILNNDLFLRELMRVRKIADEEGKRFIQPELDRYHSKGLESWKEKNLENLIEKEVQKRNPEQSEEQKRISALEKELEKRDAEAKREKLRSNALGKAQELNLPTSLVDRFLGDSDEDTEQNLKALKETFDKYVQEGVESKFKSSGRDVKESQNQGLDSSNVKSIEEMAKEINIRK